MCILTVTKQSLRASNMLQPLALKGKMSRGILGFCLKQVWALHLGRPHQGNVEVGALRLHPGQKHLCRTAAECLLQQ